MFVYFEVKKVCFVVSWVDVVDVMILLVEIVVIGNGLVDKVVDMLWEIIWFKGVVELVLFGLLFNDGKVIFDECDYI